MNRLIFPLIIISVVLLQGCIEIVEEVTVRDDRSGSISLSVEVGRGNPLMGIFGSFTDLSFPDEIVDMAEFYSRELQKQDGISNVQLINKSKNGMLSLSFDFENQRKLNRALYAMADVEKTIFKPNIYKIKNKKLERRNVTKLVKLVIEDAKDVEAGEVLYEIISIRSVFNTPKDTRRVSTNMPAEISRNKRVVTTKIELTELYEKNVSTRLRVKY
jgi:hypothetical protein